MWGLWFCFVLIRGCATNSSWRIELQLIWSLTRSSNIFKINLKLSLPLTLNWYHIMLMLSLHVLTTSKPRRDRFGSSRSSAAGQPQRYTHCNEWDAQDAGSVPSVTISMARDQRPLCQDHWQSTLVQYPVVNTPENSWNKNLKTRCRLCMNM